MSTTVWQDEQARREETLRLGLWMFLATVAMLFAAFASAYIVRRSGSDWSRINLPGVLGWNTLLLVASSLALEAGARFGARHRWSAAAPAMTLALALGLGFMAGQYSAWQQLLQAGVYMPATPHSSFFYMLTAVHGLHVMVALVVLAWAAARTWRRDEVRRWTRLVGATRTLWHFLLGVWLFVFALLANF